MDELHHDNGMGQPASEWVDAAPFRAHARALITETGLPWRIVAAHAHIAPRALHTLLHGRGNGRPVRQIHITVARSLAATSVESIGEAEKEQTDAGPVRALLDALTRLGVAPLSVSRYISLADWQHISQTRTPFCSVAEAAAVTACYDLITSDAAQRRRVTRGGPPSTTARHVDCGPHGRRLDRKRDTWLPPSFSSPTPLRTR
jgi:hypothetical protein